MRKTQKPGKNEGTLGSILTAVALSLALASSCGSEESAQERQSARGIPGEIYRYQLEQVNQDKGSMRAGHAFGTVLGREVNEGEAVRERGGYTENLIQSRL